MQANKTGVTHRTHIDKAYVTIGHIARLDADVPAHQALYLQTKISTGRNPGTSWKSCQVVPGNMDLSDSIWYWNAIAHLLGCLHSIFNIQCSIVQDTVGTSYSIDLCSHDLITKSWWKRSRVATKKKQYSLESVAELLQCQWSHDVWHHWTFTSKFSCANKSRRSKDRTVYTVH